MLWWICCFNKTNKGTSYKQITTFYLHICITRTLMRFCINCHTYSDKGKLTKKLFDNIDFMFRKLSQLGLRLAGKSSSSQIIPVIIGDEKTAIEFSKRLLD